MTRRSGGRLPHEPLERADRIGMDINLAVSESLYERSYFQPRFRLSPLQRGMVEAGLLGRKTGRGFYGYGSSSKKGEESAQNVSPGDISVVGDAELAGALGVESGAGGLKILALEDGATAAESGAEAGAASYP